MEILKSTKTGFLLNFKNITVCLNDEDKKADVILFTELKNLTSTQETKIFDSPGEYEVKNCMIDGIAIGKNNTAYSIISEDLRIGFINKIDSQLSDDQIEAFAAVDVLILPIVGDKAEVTTKIVSQIEPKIIIAHDYNDDSLKLFIAKFGKDSEKVPKFKVSSKDLSDSEQQRLVVIE